MNLSHIVTVTVSSVLGLAGVGMTSTHAHAYQIDCAILLCLAGGFPTSEPCTRARAEMIRRITPWPIEPPLQLWRCPMQAGFQSIPLDQTPPTEASFTATRHAFSGFQTKPLDGIWKAFGENVTDYVMAIKVYDLTYRRNRNHDGDCNEWGTLRLGDYDSDWNFSWKSVSLGVSPDWLFNTRHDGCSSAWFRGIGMEWRDHEGTKGTEVVRY